MFKLMVLPVFLFCFEYISGHGMMMDPINRSSIWRVNESFPHNYEDNQNFCGGFVVQYFNNSGKCGICGDNYADPRPRANENTGFYGTGHIVEVYNQGSVIHVKTLLTANHVGYFQYGLCVLEDSNAPEPNEECFQLLKFADGSDRYNVSRHDELVDNFVKLPDGLTCDHCVFRWHYRTGNSWGTCEDGSQGMGCGNQEIFRSCSDISIV